MKENVEFKGEWFLPSAKENRINGILTYDVNEDILLELFGSFHKDTFLPSLKDEEIIQGITSDSKQITLYRCYNIEAGGKTFVRGGESGKPSTIYSVKYIFEGAYIDSKEEMKFQKIISEIHNLDEWVGISGFIPEGINIANTPKIEVSVHYKLPDPIKFFINDKLEGQFDFIINVPGLPRFQKNIALNQKVALIISSENDYDIDNLLRILFGFQNFLILALYNRTYVTSIELYGKNFTRDYGDGKPARKKIKLYLHFSNRSKNVKPKQDFEMLFGYRQIIEEFPTIIRNWYEKYELLEPALNLLFEQFYNSERFSVNTFLNLAQSAETFHARTNNHPRMPKEDFNKMKDEIYRLVPKNYHEWLKDQFNFGNNLNLHTRLTEIVTKYSNEALDKVIGDKELFVKQIKWSRNYYTHYSTSGDKQALKGQDLFDLTEKLKIVLVCSFLIEVGFNNEKLTKMLEESRKWFLNHLI